MNKPSGAVDVLKDRHRGESIRSLFHRKKISPTNLADGLDNTSKANSMAIGLASGVNTPLEKSIREESSEGGTPHLFNQENSTKLNMKVSRVLTESSD